MVVVFLIRNPIQVLDPAPDWFIRRRFSGQQRKRAAVNSWSKDEPVLQHISTRRPCFFYQNRTTWRIAFRSFAEAKALGGEKSWVKTSVVGFRFPRSPADGSPTQVPFAEERERRTESEKRSALRRPVTEVFARTSPTDLSSTSETTYLYEKLQNPRNGFPPLAIITLRV